MRLHDIIWSGLSAALGTHDLESIVSTASEKIETAQMLDNLSASPIAPRWSNTASSVVDVRIKRLNLPEQNKQSVYARMRAERERIARQYRAEGEEQALSIRADADRQREEILSLAYKQAEKTKGEGDAESTRIYGAGVLEESASSTSCCARSSPTRRCSTTRPRPSSVPIPSC